MSKGMRSPTRFMAHAFVPLLLVLCCLLLTVGACESVQRPSAVTVAETTPPDTQGPATSESSASAQLGQPIDLLIVTPPEFAAEAQKIADWKNSTGMPTGVVTLTDVYEMCEGRDEPEKIKRCLSFYQQQSGIKYALLLGDGDIFPVRFTAFLSMNSSSPADSIWTYYPADLYYADLYKQDGSFDDWDANQNGYFGEIGDPTAPETLNVDQVDLTPDIAVGRVPATTPVEVAVYRGKIVAYESNAWQSAWSKRLLAIVADEVMPDATIYEEETLSAFSSDWTMVRYYSRGGPGEQAGELTADNLKRELEAGVGLISFQGHGTTNEWTGALTADEIVKLQNTTRPAITFGLACSTAGFVPSAPGEPYRDVDGVDHAGIVGGEDLGTRPPLPAPVQATDAYYCFMESTLIESQGGFVTYIGCVTLGQIGPALNLKDAFFRAIAAGAPTVGDAWKTAIPAYYQMDRFKPTHEKGYDYGGIMGNFQQPWIFMLFGDPSLRIGGVEQ